jgi:hypothetical protein
MEFRIFLPYCLPTDVEWAEVDDLAQYEGYLDRLLDTCGTEFPEKRDDTYLVGTPWYGLKYRAGDKLEIKVRTGCMEHNIEVWKKIKLGKGLRIRDRKDELLKLLGTEGCVLPCDSGLIAAEKMVCVRKARGQISYGTSTIREVCLMTTDAHERRWLSLCVEGPKEEMKTLLRGPEFGRGIPTSLMWETLHCAAKLARSRNLGKAAAAGFVPVAAGYPTWIRVASRNTTGMQEVMGVVGAVDAFLASVMWEPPAAAARAASSLPPPAPGKA